MVTITISLTEEQKDLLIERATKLGLSVEELARVSVEEWLNRSQDDFEKAAQHVLTKNAELYRRLA